MNAPILSPAHILWAFGIGSAYAFWPIIGKYSQASGEWVNTIVVISSTIIAIGLAFSSVKEQPLPTLNAFAVLLLAGLLNGAAVYFYSMKATDPQVPTGAFIMTTIVIMVAMAPLFNYLLNGVALSLKQLAGLGAAALAIALLAG